MMGRIGRALARLHRDERGAEGLEKLLIVAAIVLPLLGLLIIFRDAIKEWVGQIWQEAREREQGQHDQFFQNDVPTGGGG